jgi:ribose 5-phosphate isomerase B
MKIALGSDEAGYRLKEEIKCLLETKGITFKDFGPYDENPVLYPDYAVSVSEAIARGEYERGILVCGTGIGMAITANKVPGIRAAVCHDVYSAERARRSNDAQIMCLGARIVGSELAKMLVSTWLLCDFSGGGSAEKVDRINYYDDLFKNNHQ